MPHSYMLTESISDTGRLDITEIRIVPRQEIRGNDILVAVKASSINNTGVWIRRDYKGSLPITSELNLTGEIKTTGGTIREFEEIVKVAFKDDVKSIIESVITLKEINGVLKRLERGEVFGKFIARP